MRPEESAIVFFAEPFRVNEACEWLERNLPDLCGYVIRVEFRLLDAPFAVVTRYELSNGHPYIGEDGRAVIAEPVTRLVGEFPAEHLLRKSS
jgi:hypothetical protein